jgi:hypothetical protein
MTPGSPSRKHRVGPATEGDEALLSAPAAVGLVAVLRPDARRGVMLQTQEQEDPGWPTI